MALDDLHARRLETLIRVFEAALDRIELTLANAGGADGNSLPGRETVVGLRSTIAAVRSRLHAAADRFGVKPWKPGWRQTLSGELSTLWVLLENSMPERMKGYGREFSPEDQEDWESFIRGLLDDIDSMRRPL